MMTAIFTQVGLGSWVSYVPTIQSTGGTWTTGATLNQARYRRVGRTCLAYGDFTLGNVAGGTTGIDFGLPFSGRVGFFFQGHGIHFDTFNIMSATVSYTGPGFATLRLSGGGNPAVTNGRYFVQVEYEMP